MDFLNKLFNLKNKVAIITGGNGLLGTEYAKALAFVGVKVAIFDISERLNLELEELRKNYSIELFKVDITKKDELEKKLKEVETRFGAPDILINNAATDSPPGADATKNRSFENYSLQDWQKVLNVNLTGVFLSCQVIGSRMAQNKHGNIVNVSSIYGLVSPHHDIYKYLAEKGTPFVKPVSYSATKSAIFGLTKYLATYWAKDNVRVNNLVLGGVFNNQDSEFLKNYCDLVPLGRMAGKDEYCGAILFLAGDAASYMTGANLIMDGGLTAW